MVDANGALAASTGVTGYWPWWVGAPVLAAITVGYALCTARALGVSGAWDRLVHWRQERQREVWDSAFVDEGQLQEVLAAATAQQFGPLDASAAGAPTTRRSRRAASMARPLNEFRPMPLACYAVLLVSIFVGGLIGALVSGRFVLRADMGEGFGRIVTGNPLLMVLLLFAGGVLVGFGTRMAGGCSSGHGLSGFSRMQFASIVATAVFFATAAVVSWLLWKVI